MSACELPTLVTHFSLAPKLQTTHAGYRLAAQLVTLTWDLFSIAFYPMMAGLEAYANDSVIRSTTTNPLTHSFCLATNSFRPTWKDLSRDSTTSTFCLASQELVTFKNHKESQMADDGRMRFTNEHTLGLFNLLDLSHIQICTHEQN